MKTLTTWYRPIGFSSASDHHLWMEEPKFKMRGWNISMGPDFFGYLIAETDNGNPPQQYGQNVVSTGMCIFSRSR